MRTVSICLGLALAAIGVPAAAAAAGAVPPRCQIGPADAAAANAASFAALPWSPFGRPEIGWAVYATRIAVEIGSDCAADTPAFAAAFARWQRVRGLAETGVLDPDNFAVMRGLWHADRAFVAQTRNGSCPAPPLRLAVASTREGYGGKTIALYPDALIAYRRMVADARRNLPGLAADRRWLTIFSGFRDPDADALRCAAEGNCQGVVRTVCSAHRTGLAVDLYVGQSPGFGPDSSDDGNRRAMVRTLAYRWLVTNAGRFGFVNYAFEPWHWEWAPGSRRRPAAAASGGA